MGVSFLENSAYFKPPKKYVVFVCKTDERDLREALVECLKIREDVG